jgi:hypothetical protein
MYGHGPLRFVQGDKCQKLIFTILPPVPTIHPARWFANDTFQKPRKSGSSLLGLALVG